MSGCAVRLRSWAGIVTIPLLPFGTRASRRRVERHRYWLTDQRLVVQDGLIGQRVSSVPLSRIVDVTVRQNWFDRLLGIQNLDVRDMIGEVGGSGMASDLALVDVADPEHRKHALLDGTHTPPAAASDAQGAMSEMVDLLQQPAHQTA